MKTSLTGIKPTGTPHLGNYLGAIRPALRLAETYKSFYFIADYHALTTLRNPTELRQYVYDVAATWLACGLDPEKTFFYRQSAVPEVFELSWVLSCLLATGQLERSHAFKDALARGEAPNAGLFNYPVLQSADIILYDAHVVPIGKDQKQHLELSRDVAQRFNHTFGENVLVVPDAIVYDELTVPGLDGEKMSKSRDNTIPLFAPTDEIKAMVMKIKSGSEPLEAPKDPASSIIYTLFKAIAPAAGTAELEKKLRAGGFGWGHAKLALVDAIEAELGPKRAVYQKLRADEAYLDDVLAKGAARASVIATATLSRVRRAIGIAR